MFFSRLRPLSVAVPAIALVAVSGCASLTPLAEQELSTVGADTIWYISTRARSAEGRDTRRLTDTLEYGLAVYAREGAKLTLADSATMDSASFVSALGMASGGGTPAFLYVHGFGTSLREAWGHTATARANAGTRAPWVVFAWPSNGKGVDWPRRGNLVDRAYRDDSTIAVRSRPAFARAARTVGSVVGHENLVLVAHSMGGKLVGESFVGDSALRADLSRAPLRAVAFVAPDVEATRFADTIAPAAQPLARRLVLYASSRDRLLAFATFLDGFDRAGHARDSALVRPGLETVDATDAPFIEGWAQRLLGMHHAMRRAAGTLHDLTHIVARGLPADCRLILGTADRDPRGVWRLTEQLPVRGGTESANDGDGGGRCGGR